MIPSGVDAELGTPNRATVVIVDDDPHPVLRISATDQVTEGGTAAVTVTRSGDTANATQVKVQLVDLAAQGRQ